MKATRSILAAFGGAALLIVLTASSKADEHGFAGTWVITGTLNDPDGYENIVPTCTFKLEAEQVSGTCKSGNAMGSVDGSVDGNDIVWHWDRIATKDNLPDGMLTFRGIMGDDGVLRGEFKDSNWGDDVGTFVGQQKT